MHSMTNSYSWGEANIAGAPSYNYGGSNEATGATLTEPSDIVIARVSGVITISTDGGSTVDHTFATSYSGIMRFFIAGDGSPFGTDFDDILFTDTDKIQRDGFINETSGSAITIGDGTAGGRYTGALMRATSTGQVSAASIIINTAASPFTSHYEIWTHDGTNPAAQIGTDSATVNLSGAGTFRMTHSDGPALTKGQLFWLIIADDTGGGSVVADKLAGPFDQGGHTIGFGASDTLTSIVDGEANDFAVEVEVTRTGEPTPDHETLLLIHEGAHGSTVLTSSDPEARAIVTAGDLEWNNGQNLGFGTTSLDFDGTGDFASMANQAPFDDLEGAGFSNITAEAIIRLGTTGVTQAVMAIGSGASWTGLTFIMYINSANKLVAQVGNGGSTGISITGSTALSSATDYHVAFVKAGTSLFVALDGTIDASTTNSLTLSTSTYDLTIGSDGRKPGDAFTGQIKEPRFSLNARWDANFTPQTSAYP